MFLCCALRDSPGAISMSELMRVVTPRQKAGKERRPALPGSIRLMIRSASWNINSECLVCYERVVNIMTLHWLTQIT